MKTLLAVLFLSACSRTWYGCPQPVFSKATKTVCLIAPREVQEGLQAAVHSWNQALNGKLSLEVGVESCDIVVQETEDPPCPQGSLACANELGGSVVYLRKGSYERQPANVLAHELGHVFGAQHLEGSLMSTTGANYACPDQTTVAQVAAYQHWNLAELRFCSL
jgi:hypothetical protein